MRVLLLSDLHLEFDAFEPPPVTDVDVVVLAGDIHVGTRGVEWAAQTFGDTPVVYVAGNHEFYGHAYPKLLGKMQETADGTSVHVLENQAVDIGGYCFLGCTLWTDFRLGGGEPREAGALAHHAMQDYRRIRRSPEFRKLRPEDTGAAHRRSRAWLREELGRRERAIVVTHHTPSPRSLAPEHAGDPLSAAFASDMHAFIEATAPIAWLHGHTHHCVDFTIADTRVVSNQRGYPGESTGGFDQRLIIQIG